MADTEGGTEQDDVSFLRTVSTVQRTALRINSESTFTKVCYDLQICDLQLANSNEPCVYLV